MKKWFAILLVASYALIISGVEVSMHYCCGKLENISVWSDASKECCGEENDDACCLGKSCCETTQFTTGQRTPHETSGFEVSTPVFVCLANALEFFEIKLDNLKASALQMPSGHDPPIKRPRFLMFSSLVFYASC